MNWIFHHSHRSSFHELVTTLANHGAVNTLDVLLRLNHFGFCYVEQIRGVARRRAYYILITNHLQIPHEANGSSLIFSE